MAQILMRDGANADIPAIQISMRQIVKAANANSNDVEARLVDWKHYALNVEYNGVETAIASGIVLECVINSVLIYRFINSTVNVNGYPSEDSFYSDFDGTNLTNLLSTRGA